jgi:hypothetical protein
LTLPTDTSTTTLNLNGTGVNTGTSFPTDYKSVVTPMELAAISPVETLGPGVSPHAHHADLKYVGVTSVRRSSSNSSRINNSTLLFGVVTQANWSTPSSEVEFDVYIDGRSSGNMNDCFATPAPTGCYALFTTRLTGTDVLVDSLFNLATRATVASSSASLNQFSSNTPTAPFNSNVIVMPLNVSLLNMGSSNTRFTYEVFGFSRFWGEIDDSGPLSYDYASPGLDFNASGTGSVMYDDLPAVQIPVTFNGPAYRLNQSKGALLLHHFNITGARDQVLGVSCNTITVTNPANAAGTAGAPFSETFTSSGGLGTVTYSLASGTLPAGLTLAANGTLSGTPTQTGSFPITVRATDGMGCFGTGSTYSLVIGCQSITVTNPAVSSTTVGAVFNQTFTASGGIGTMTFSTTSTLPTGLTLASNGVLSGTPTQAGSFGIVVKATDSNGCFGTGPTYNLVVHPPVSVRSDINGDGKSDILLYNSAGDVAEWQMNGLSINAGRVISSPGSGWVVRFSGDFDADGKWDIILQNTTTGDVAEWKMDGFSITSGAIIGTAGPTWVPVFSGDFDGDGKADILLQNSATGSIAMWLMNGFNISAGAVVADPGPSWQVRGTGDFDGDGKSDILLQNSVSGNIAEWQMNGTSVVGGAVIASLGTSWSVRGGGDFNGDGKADIILQNTSSGSVVEWQMSGFTISAGASIGEPGTDWTVVGAGDYNGDGKSDLILRNAAGDVAGWLINGMSVTAGRIIDSPGTTWVPIAQ